jgi:hypothetical protein
MKTQVLQLEHFDDVASVCDKIHWTKSPRVLLVWPAGEKELLTRLDLVMIYREGIKIGVQLALVSRHPDVKRNARNLDIPIYPSVIRAQRAPWRRSRKIWHAIRSANTRDALTRAALESQRRPVSTAFGPIFPRLAVFSIGILAVILLILFFFPSATIYFQIPSQRQQLDLQLTANSEVTSANLSLEIPALSTSVIVERQQEVTSSGQTAVADEAARGRVQFTNLTSQELEIPAGTVVSTAAASPTRFRTLENVTIPALERQSDEVAIEALLPGDGGNVQAGEIRVIENELGTLAGVQNLEPTSGGTENEVPSPTSMDYSNLQDEMLSSLEVQAAELMTGGIPTGSKLVSETIRMDEMVEVTYSPDIGTPGDTATLSIRAKYTALYILQSDVNAAAQIAMDAALPAGFSARDGDIEITPLNEPYLDNGRITWNISVTRRIYKDFDQQQLVKQIAGEKVKTAAEILKQDYGLAQEPTIQVFPAWWPRVPFTAFRIAVVEQ